VILDIKKLTQKHLLNEENESQNLKMKKLELAYERAGL